MSGEGLEMEDNVLNVQDLIDDLQARAIHARNQGESSKVNELKVYYDKDWSKIVPVEEAYWFEHAEYDDDGELIQKIQVRVKMKEKEQVYAQ